jgi:hypothetical protein
MPYALESTKGRSLLSDEYVRFGAAHTLRDPGLWIPFHAS